MYDVRHGILQALGGWGGSGNNNVEEWKFGERSETGGVFIQRCAIYKFLFLVLTSYAQLPANFRPPFKNPSAAAAERPCIDCPTVDVTVREK